MFIYDFLIRMGVDFCRLPPSSLSSPHSSLRRSSSIEKLPVPLPTTPSAPGVANSQTKPTSLLLVPSTGSRLLQDLSPSIRRRIYKDKQGNHSKIYSDIHIQGCSTFRMHRTCFIQFLAFFLQSSTIFLCHLVHCVESWAKYLFVFFCTHHFISLE